MANGIHAYTVQEAVNLQLGQGGYDLVEDEATVNQSSNPNTEWVAIQMVVGATITSATSADTSLWDDIVTLEVPAGTTIYGRWTAIQIGADDSAICYRG